MMSIAMLETCWAYKKYNKIASDLVGFLFFSYHNDARSNKHQIYKEIFVLNYAIPSTKGAKIFNNGPRGSTQLQNDSGKHVVTPIWLLFHVCWLIA